MTTIKEMTDCVVEFRDQRDWAQFHTPKDLATSLTLEAAEVAEHFLWKNPEEVADHVASSNEELGDELADVLMCVLLMSDTFKIDLEAAFVRKLEKNRVKYPLERARGTHKKYTQI